ncbi:hypothetical protein D3C81_1653150 [compost metagenome]
MLIPSALVSRQGMTTIVADSGGIPLEKSMRGSGRGVRKRVVASLSRSLASWLSTIISGSARRISSQPIPCCAVRCRISAVAAVVNRLRLPSHDISGIWLKLCRRRISRDASAVSRISSCWRPSPFR